MGGRQEEQAEGEKDRKENLFKRVRAVENYSPLSSDGFIVQNSAHTNIKIIFYAQKTLKPGKGDSDAFEVNYFC